MQRALAGVERSIMETAKTLGSAAGSKGVCIAVKTLLPAQAVAPTHKEALCLSCLSYLLFF